MAFALAFGVTLLVGVLISERARTTVMSTSVLFLVAGFLLGNGWLGWVRVDFRGPLTVWFAELALFSILLVEGTQLGIRDVLKSWRLPGRALLLGLPLTVLALAVAAHALLGTPWLQAALVGAILSPTDPVFAVAILEHEAVPLRVRRLLSLESSINDGLALPLVMVLLAAARGEVPAPVRVSAELLLGTAVGIAIPWLFIRLERTRLFAASEAYRPLGGVAVGISVFAVSRLLGLNEFLAAFAAGTTAASLVPRRAEHFRSFGAPLAELLKLAALFVFGAALRPAVFTHAGWRGYAFAAAALFLARPLAISASLLGTQLSRREQLAAAWFGPKGFASVLYGLLLVSRGVSGGEALFSAIALVIAASVVAHSSTDVLVARTFSAAERDRERRPPPGAVQVGP